MWFLSRIVGNARTQAKVLARLKPNGSYVVNPRGSQDMSTTVRFRVLGFSAADVASSKARPDVIFERRGLSVVIDGQLVTEDQKYLHDQQLLHIGRGNEPFLLTWEPVSIYHNKEQNPDMHEKLIEQGQQVGFYVIDCIRSNYDKPTHYCLSTTTDLFELTTRSCLDLAFNKVYFVEPATIEEMCKAGDKKFDLKAFNDKIQPITIDNFEGLDQTAILGPDERRKRLFKSMDFWFFDRQQFENYVDFIKIVGGKAHLKTCEEVLASDIEGNPLFVAPPNANMLPDWIHVHEKYCQEMDVIRVLYDKEIMYAIVFCSTNLMCNPASKPMEHMNPDSAVYASFESASLHPASVKIESLDSTVPVTYPQDDSNYMHHQGQNDDDDDWIRVKPEPVDSPPHNSASLEHVEQATSQQAQEEGDHARHRPIVKEEVHERDQEMQEAHHQSAPPSQEEEENLPDTVPAGMSPTYHSPPAHHSSPPHPSPVAAELPAPAEVSPAYQTPEEAVPANSSPPLALSWPSISQQIEPINAIPASMDLDLDVDAFLGGAFENLQSQKKKDKEKKMQEEEEADKKRREEERREQENRRKEEARQELLREQIAHERAEYEAQLQAHVDYNAGRGRATANRDAVMEEQEEEEESTHDPEEEPLQQDEGQADQEQPSSAPTDQQQQQQEEEAPLDYRSDPTVISVVEPNPDHGQFSRIIYRNLEVNPRPAPPTNGIVNYKKFKKVKQFENYSSFEQSQHAFPAPNATTSQNNNNRRRARDIFHDTDPGSLIPEDPDIAIRVNRPRFR